MKAVTFGTVLRCVNQSEKVTEKAAPHGIQGQSTHHDNDDGELDGAGVGLAVQKGLKETAGGDDGELRDLIEAH